MNKAAAAGFLGGRENIAEDLKEIRIRFGEPSVHNDTDCQQHTPTKAGPGIYEEVEGLRKGKYYGILLGSRVNLVVIGFS